MLYAASAASLASGSAGFFAGRIREARLQDAAAIARVQVDTSRLAYRGLVPTSVLRRLSFPAQLRCWQRRLGSADPAFIVRVAETAAGDVVGVAAAGPARMPLEDFDNELFVIYVLTSHQSCGVGVRLFRSLVSAINHRGGRSLIAWVIASNSPRNFFESLAGRPVAMEVARGTGVVRKVAYGWRRLSEIDTRDAHDRWCASRRPSEAAFHADTWSDMR